MITLLEWRWAAGMNRASARCQNLESARQGLHLLTLTSGPSWGPFLLAVSFLTKDHISLFLCMSREISIPYWVLCVCGMLQTQDSVFF